ncbi:ATP-binding protein [Leptolyngbya sp. AN03gr2]|uniref:ATP-binding protein n=1 Tax=unclassified Leptolyngbya TaxID=2650499 RepID=UPI003D30F654
MTITDNSSINTWQATNQAYLMASLAHVREYLANHIDKKRSFSEFNSLEQSLLQSLNTQSGLPALERLCSIFGLSEFERNVLLLCAGVELDASFSPLCAAAQDDQQRTYPTFSLALAALPNAHWSALTPAAPLRRWRLVEIGAGNHLTTSPLRIDERVLHYLVGISHLDERLMQIVEPIETEDNLVASHWELSEQLVAAWSTQQAYESLPILQLCGYESASKRSIAATACHFLGLNLYSIPAYSIPLTSNDLSQFKLLWERETILSRSALMIDCDELDSADSVREAAIAHLSESLQTPLIILSTDRRKARSRPMLAFDILRPTPAEQRSTWEFALGETAEKLDRYIDELVTQFSLSTPVIQAISNQVQADQKTTEIKSHLWNACRAQARPKLDDLAQRIETYAGWEELILPESQMNTLKEITSQVQQRATVYGQWGFAGKSARGLGISGLFAGTSGTGKTTAAEVMARELRLDLYRIDLSMVISKYIGETEKNLGRIFDAAEMGGVILLFDEADALFGKRTEVKDSHDRHANVEVSYLLQRMEAFRGLSVLTTNLKSALDQAFLRRLRFVVQFSFPDAEQRAEIWRRVFPKSSPTQELDHKKLGQLNVAGGNIRNIALNAAFIAADANEPIMMKHVLLAAKNEYMKLERPLTDAEIRGWIS